ncbi:hypothetical protein HU200_039977 [Digitaria exilis]|uniref:Uncharacterized protein n=1 Tax=Digitaria exilis TaxID=1010633 RepID=A0A835B9Q4_9POAL|nr:hypothetical protein HU200_039977 [Digitaria exilis]CAB3482431.1 unnamed protein product [Digitaria exilis]
MESAAARGPCEFQRAQWTAEELVAADEVWAPAAGLPLDYASIDIFPSIWSLQPYVPSSPSGVVEYYNYYAASTQYAGPIVEEVEAAAQESFEVDLRHDMEMEIDKKNAIGLFEEAARKFKSDIDMMKQKIHRYPPSIEGMDTYYTVPRIVAIGPYHHEKWKLKEAEKVKHVAAYHCIKESGGLYVQEMYEAVVSVMEKIDARRLYDKEVMEGMSDNEFQPMMFYDACFLVMYMMIRTSNDADYNEYGLRDFFESNDRDIAHDIMLLENQIPWSVVDAIMKYTSVHLENFITIWKDDCLLDRVVGELDAIMWNDNYKPPHLLGLLRFYIVGTISKPEVSGVNNMRSITISVSAIELTEMGISLADNETECIADMELTKRWIYFAKLSMAPLSLNDLRASHLVNMAAHELCTTPDFLDGNAAFEDSAVCSYLLLLCMLMCNHDNVEHLRTSGILQGGAGLTNKQTLDFFTSLQSLRQGRCYSRVMVQIESYKNSRPLRNKAYAFVYNNWKTILKVGSAVVALITILGTLKSLSSPGN